MGQMLKTHTTLNTQLTTTKMAAKFLIFCASALFVQAVVGNVIQLPPPGLVYGLPPANAASSAASAAAANNAAAAAAAASAAAAGKGAASSAASAAAAKNAAAATAAAASAAAANSALRGLPSASSAAAAAAAAAAASSGLPPAPLIGLPGVNIVPSEPLLVTSLSPIAPSGLSVSSEIALEGALDLLGLLPFLSAVSFEGALPTAGSGTATCGCGSGTVGILSAL